MKQILLAIMLIAVPVAGFTAYQVYAAHGRPPSAIGLGDLTGLETIVGDVQALAAKGDLPGAAKRITDFESAWDEQETAMRPLNPDYWGHIDDAADHALKALRVSAPAADTVRTTLAALMSALTDPSKPAAAL